MSDEYRYIGLRSDLDPKTTKSINATIQSVNPDTTKWRIGAELLKETVGVDRIADINVRAAWSSKPWDKLYLLLGIDKRTYVFEKVR